MAEQDLDRAEITGRFVDDRRLRSPQRVRAIIFAWQADARHPLIHEASVLAGAHMSRMIGAAWEGIILQGSAPQLQPPEQTSASIVHQFELDRSPGLLLNDNRPRPNFPVTNDVANLDLHQVAATKLAVDRKVEKRPIPGPPMLIKKEADCPDLDLPPPSGPIGVLLN